MHRNVGSVSARARIGLVVAAALAAFAMTTATPARAATGCASDAALDGEESAFLTIINNYRAAEGVSALRPSASLAGSAGWLALDSGTRGYFSHIDPSGSDPSARGNACGYPGLVAENIAAGEFLSSGQAAFEAWRNSPSHNANMLNPTYRWIGIARVYVPGSPYGWYWVTDFGLVDDAGTAAAAVNDQRVPVWVNDLAYGSSGGGFYWDFGSGTAWTAERGWHAFAPVPTRAVTPLWVNDLEYGSRGGGFYLDPIANQVWTAERGWHTFSPGG